MRHFPGAKTGLAAIAMALAAQATPATAQDWSDEIEVFRIGLLGGENEADRLRRYDCFQTLMSELLGVPVELYPAADYAGVMQGLLADQLDMAQLGASGYAGIYLQDPEAVVPVVASAQTDGSLGYHSVMLVRADSDIQSLEEMEGRTLAFADPNSTSGYLVPSAELESQGINIENYFSETNFAGGHEQGVVAVLNEQYDAAVTWTSMIGAESEGYTRGNLRLMVDNGLLDMDDVRIIWESSLIPNGPTVLRTELPDELKQTVTDFLLTMSEEHPECYAETVGGEGAGFAEIDHAFYENVVAMRRAELEESR